MYKTLASDNFSGAHPLVMQAVMVANEAHAAAYGADPCTAQAQELFKDIFGVKTSAHFVFNGTAANVLSLSIFHKPHGVVLCSNCAHIANDESTAPEKLLGMRIKTLPSHNGKIQPEALKAACAGGHGVHAPLPTVLSLTQPTELGTVYTAEEIATLVCVAKKHGLGVHVDGARLGCAVVALGISPKEMLAGVDVLSFGGTKQGMLFGEAVLIFNSELGAEFPYWQKFSMQLASKMRFISAQFLALLKDDLWLKNAKVSLNMTKLLYSELQHLPAVKILYPVEANAIFAQIPPDTIKPLQDITFFWPWKEEEGSVRWMCGFDTTAQDISAFVGALKGVLPKF